MFLIESAKVAVKYNFRTLSNRDNVFFFKKLKFWY